MGFDLVNTASNHAVDGRLAGIVRTLDVLDEAGLDHVGTYRTQEERDENSGILVKEINGITAAFLDFTYGTHAIPVDDYPYAVNVYNLDYMTTLVDVDYEMLDADMAAARALDTDVIIVTVHWARSISPGPRSTSARWPTISSPRGRTSSSAGTRTCRSRWSCGA